MAAYLSAPFSAHPLAAEFEKYLERHCRWSPSDFDGDAWSGPVPPRERWAAEVESFNAQLARLEREQGEGYDPDHDPGPMGLFL